MQTQSLTDLATARALRIDPPRNEPRVKMAVSSRSAGHIVAGVRLEAGEQTIEVYASDVALVTAEVETEKLDSARGRLRSYEQALADKAAGKPVPDQSLPNGTPSLEACFRELHFRDIRPLASACRLDEEAARPEKR